MLNLANRLTATQLFNILNPNASLDDAVDYSKSKAPYIPRTNHIANSLVKYSSHVRFSTAEVRTINTKQVKWTSSEHPAQAIFSVRDGHISHCYRCHVLEGPYSQLCLQCAFTPFFPLLEI